MEWTVTTTATDKRKKRGRRMDFTPTWRTAGESGQPDIGSGTLAGVVDDETGEMTITLEVAQDTDMGLGYWIFGVPPELVNLMGMNPNGKVLTVDDTGYEYPALGLLDRHRGEITCESEGQLWSATVPVTFAAGALITITHVRR